MYSYIKEYFDFKLYSNDDVKIFVKVNWISDVEYKTITGIDYVA
ncbi:XkdX family protein [Clostridium beijerinckii]|nr:XkdX family protein [Clostridium beijerinckii]